jgi:hypothetical protein
MSRCDSGETEVIVMVAQIDILDVVQRLDRAGYPATFTGADGDYHITGDSRYIVTVEKVDREDHASDLIQVLWGDEFSLIEFDGDAGVAKFELTQSG